MNLCMCVIGRIIVVNGDGVMVVLIWEWESYGNFVDNGMFYIFIVMVVIYVYRFVKNIIEMYF